MEAALQTGFQAPASSSLNPERWVEEHCDVLFRYARARVRDPDTASDLVQETMLAAWKSAPRFDGRASERTWIMRIMRNKIADHYRKRRPEFAVDDLSELERLEEMQFNQSGLHKGAWAAGASPGRWSDAAQCMEHSEFWEVVHQCADRLPPKAANVFLMREVDGQTNAEISSSLDISPNHLGVLLHRARLAMRRCLELHWFREPS
jgi:RNA polymerase sigma-70 factor (TIGR02943 family)